jgi:hypothetical protein
MPNDTNANDPRSLWQGQEEEKVTITIDEIRVRATYFERRIQRRNMREYAATGVAVVVLTIQAWGAHGWHLATFALLMAGMAYAMFQLHRLGARSLPADTGTRASLEFHRLELERQRDALRTVWRWYLLPFAPGILMSVGVKAIEHGITAKLVGLTAFIVLLFVGAWALNQSAARKLERRIQALKAMEPGGE